MKQAGFSLIELIIFIIVSSILAIALLRTYVSLLRMPNLLPNTIANTRARQCADWYLMRRRTLGYTAVSGTNCTSPLTVPASICTVPTGYSITATCAATNIRGETNYVTITINVSGPGLAAISLLLGDY